VDRQTGSVSLERAIWVDECGEVINPLLADGQLMGGFAQGYGEAFCESIRYDSDGQIVTGSLMDYALPRADDLICLEISHFFPTQAPPHDARPGASQAIRNGRASAGLPNPLGVSGVGESGSIAAPAALVNAVIDAVSNTVDGHCIELPLKPETIWRMIQKKHA
jgi:carbon-monoxide dehydrogenase large subunit